MHADRCAELPPTPVPRHDHTPLLRPWLDGLRRAGPLRSRCRGATAATLSGRGAAHRRRRRPRSGPRSRARLLERAERPGRRDLRRGPRRPGQARGGVRQGRPPGRDLRGPARGAGPGRRRRRLDRDAEPPARAAGDLGLSGRQGRLPARSRSLTTCWRGRPGSPQPRHASYGSRSSPPGPRAARARRPSAEAHRAGSTPASSASSSWSHAGSATRAAAQSIGKRQRARRQSPAAHRLRPVVRPGADGAADAARAALRLALGLRRRATATWATRASTRWTSPLGARRGSGLPLARRQHRCGASATTTTGTRANTQIVVLRLRPRSADPLRGARAAPTNKRGAREQLELGRHGSVPRRGHRGAWSTARTDYLKLHQQLRQGHRLRPRGQGGPELEAARGNHFAQLHRRRCAGRKLEGAATPTSARGTCRARCATWGTTRTGSAPEADPDSVRESCRESNCRRSRAAAVEAFDRLLRRTSRRTSVDLEQTSRPRCGTVGRAFEPRDRALRRRRAR